MLSQTKLSKLQMFPGGFYNSLMAVLTRVFPQTFARRGESWYQYFCKKAVSGTNYIIASVLKYVLDHIVSPLTHIWQM